MRSARTARTYPVGYERFLRAVDDAVRGMPRWELRLCAGADFLAVRRARIGPGMEVVLRLVPLESGDHANTLVGFQARSTALAWGLGEGKRGLDGLIGAIDTSLIPET